MRIFIIFCVFFFVVSGLRAQQSFNKAYHSASQFASPFALTINGSYYHIVKVRDNSAERGQAFLYKHANDSTCKFRKPIIQYFKLDINEAFVTKDKAMVVLCNDEYCGYNSSQSTSSYLVKLDTNGNQVFKTAVSRQFYIVPQGGDSGVPIMDGFKHGFQNIDSTYTVFSDSVMFKFSSHGQFMSRKNLGTDSITSVILLPNNNILLNAHIGTTHNLMVISQGGTVISTTPFQASLKKLLYYNGNKIMGLSNGNLYKITPNFGLITNTNYSSNTKVIDFLCAADTIYTCRMGSNSTSSFFACDTAFNPIFNSTISTKSLTPVAICKYNQKVIIVANSTSDNQNALSQNYFSSITVFDKNSIPLHNLNIALTNVNVDTAYYVLNYNNGYTTTFDLYLRVKFYAKNKCNLPIKRFKFTCGTSFYSSNCGISDFYQESFSGLNILPGDSIQLTSGLIYRTAVLYNYGNSYPGIPQQHCVFLTLPNDEVDGNQSDNEKCVTEAFNGLGIKVVNASEQRITTFPNPFSNSLNINSVNQIVKLSIYNSIGQAVIQMQNPVKNLEFQTSQFDKGLYLLQIETKEGVSIRRIIKE